MGCHENTRSALLSTVLLQWQTVSSVSLKKLCHADIFLCSFILISFEIELYACINKLWKMCNCVLVCDVARGREVGCAACVEGNKDVHEVAWPQRACHSHNHVRYYSRKAFFSQLIYSGYITTLQGILYDMLLL